MSTPGDAGTIERVLGARWLLLQWARREVRVRYRQSVLGLAWTVLQPTLLLCVYGVLFTRVLGVESPRGPYALFAWCGLTVWAFTSTVMSVGSLGFVTAMPIVSKVYFPREVVPLAVVGAVTVDLLVATAILLVLAATTWSVSITFLALVPVLVGLVLLDAALVTLLSAMTGFVRDLRHALPLLLQLGFIASPVMYDDDLVPSAWRGLYSLNPIARVIGAVREAVIEQRWPPVADLVGLPVVGALLLLLALRYVRAIEHRLPDLV